MRVRINEVSLYKVAECIRVYVCARLLPVEAAAVCEVHPKCFAAMLSVRT